MPARILVIALLGLAYVAASHWLMTRAMPSPWNAVALLTPMLAAAGIALLKTGHRVRGCIAWAAIAALCVQAASGFQVPAPLLYLGQHVAIHLLLAMGFASTLRPGAEPLISSLAATVHGPLAPTMATYTRNVTRAWVTYFVGMAAVSVLLFAAVPFAAWAAFANLLTPLAVVAMFGAERLLRYRLHPEFKRSSILDAVRAYRRVGVVAAARSEVPARPPAEPERL